VIAAGAVAVIAIVALAVIVQGGGTSAERQIAQAINLHASDLPGFSVAPPDHAGTGDQIDSRMQNCVGRGTGEHPGAVGMSSPQFTSGSGLQAEQVGSDATIERSTGVVASDLALARSLLQSGQMQSCLSQAFDSVTIPTSSGLPVTISRVTAAALSEPVSGSDRSFGLRATIWMSALGRSVPVVLDIIGYAVGRDELTLDTLGIGQPFAPSIEHQLSALLVARAVAHPH